MNTKKNKKKRKETPKTETDDVTTFFFFFYFPPPPRSNSSPVETAVLQPLVNSQFLGAGLTRMKHYRSMLSLIFSCVCVCLCLCVCVCAILVFFNKRGNSINRGKMVFHFPFTSSNFADSSCLLLLPLK